MSSLSFTPDMLRVTYTPPSSWSSLPFSGIPDIKLSLGDLAPKASTSTTSNGAKPSPQSIIEDIRKVAKDHGADLSGVKSAVESAESERKTKIVNALKGVADLELVKGTKGRRFIVAYWRHNETRTAQGVEYPVELDEDGDPIGISVLVNDADHPFCSTHRSMDNFRKVLENYGPYHIAYFDEKA